MSQLPILQDDVRSLSLPGSYCEKITHLGRSLMGFTRLKHLDLSRNAIESLEVRKFKGYGCHSDAILLLQGLQDLAHLETLNLYPFCANLGDGHTSGLCKLVMHLSILGPTPHTGLWWELMGIIQ
jgi:hypothetical protein